MTRCTSDIVLFTATVQELLGHTSPGPKQVLDVADVSTRVFDMEDVHHG